MRVRATVMALALAALGSGLAAAETIDPWTGALTLVERDLGLQAGALRLDVQRVYRSGGDSGGMLGPGWRLTLEKRLVRTDAGVEIQEASGTVFFTPAGSAGVFGAAPGEQVTLAPTGGAVRTRADDAVETYDPDGRLSQIKRPDGTAIALRYDGGRLTRAEGPGGNALRFSTDAAGRLVRVDSSTEVTATYRYAASRLAEVQVNGGPLTRYAYDGQGRLTRIEEPWNGVREFAYDGQGRVAQRKFADGAVERYEYDDAAHAVRVTDPTGGVTSRRRSADKREEEITDPIGRRTVIRYDDAGRMVSVTAANGLVANTTYDALGRLASAGMPGFETRLEYVGDSQTVAAATFPGGSRQTFAYDSNRNLIAVNEDGATVGTFTYGADGQVASMTERGAPERRYAYTPDGRLKSEIEVGGRSWQFEYDRHGNVVKESDGAGRVTAFSYDAQDRPVAVTDPAGAVTRYACDEGGRVTEMTDPVGRVVHLEYDARGRLVSQQDAAGRTTQYRWDGAGRLTGVVRPGGATTSYVYDRAGNLLREVNPVGGVTHYVYDAAGQLASVTDPEGATWKYEYSMPGQVGKIIAPGGLVKEITYDARRRGSGLVDAAGGVSRVERDSQGRATKALLPGGVWEAVSFDTAGRVAQESSSTGGSVSYDYDAASRPVRARLSTGHEVVVEYDPSGQLARVHDSSGATLSYRYNAQGLRTAQTDQAGLTTTMAYDASGLLTEIVNPLGQARRFAYGPGGDLTRVTEANGDTVALDYDSAGNLAAVRHPGGGVTRFVRDALYQPVELEDPLGSRSQFLYDMVGRLTRAVDADGVVTAYSYNQLGRLAQKRLPDGVVVNYAYDAAGRLVAVDDGAFPVRYTYDGAGRRTRIEYPAIRTFIAYEYDAGGQLAKLLLPGGNQIRYGYDDNKRVTSMTLSDGRAFRFGYDPKDRLTLLQYPNGVGGAWEWDASGHLVHVSYHNSAGQEIDGCRYSYDNAGRLVRAVTWDGETTTYRHDAAGQLLEEASAAGAIRYQYAPGGNRTRREAGGKVTEYTHNAADQMVTAGDERIAYDARGNMTERTGPAGVTRYGWDGDNRLVRVTNAGGGEVSYGYTATGSRAWRKDAHGTTYFVGDGANLLADLDQGMTPITIYVHGPGVDRPLAMLRGGQLYCYHARSLGTVSSITDAAGKVVARYRMDAFGNLTSSTGTLPNRLLLAAREYDADVGLYHNRARAYDPGLGRFLSADPDWSSYTDPIGANRYAYVLNAPVNYADPTGAREMSDEQIFSRYGLTPEMIKAVVRGRMYGLGESAQEAGRWLETNLAARGQRQKGWDLFRALKQGDAANQAAGASSPEQDLNARLDAEQRARDGARARPEAEAPQRPQPEAPRPQQPVGNPAPSNVSDAERAASARATGEIPAAAEGPARGPEFKTMRNWPKAETFPKQGRLGKWLAKRGWDGGPIEVSAEAVGGAGLGAAAGVSSVWADWEEGKDLGQAVKDEAWSTLKWGGGGLLLALAVPALAPAIGTVGLVAATVGLARNAARITVARTERPAVEAEARRAQQIAVNAGLIDEIMNEMEGMVTSEEAALTDIRDRWYKVSPGYGVIQDALQQAKDAQKELDALSSTVHSAAAGAGDAAELKSAIDDAVTGMKSDQDRVNKLLADIRSLAERCASEDDAKQAETMLQSCGPLLAGLAQRADAARAQAAKLAEIQQAARDSALHMARAEKLHGEIATAADRAARTQASFADARAQREQLAKEYGERAAALRARLKRLRAQLPAVLPSPPPPSGPPPSGPPPTNYKERYDSLVARAEKFHSLAGDRDLSSPSSITPEEATDKANDVVQIKLDADATMSQMQTDAETLANVPTEAAVRQSIDDAAGVPSGSEDLAAKIAACRDRLKGGPGQQQGGANPGGGEVDLAGAKAGGFQEVGEATGKDTQPAKAGEEPNPQGGFQEVEENAGKDTSAAPTPPAGAGTGPGATPDDTPLQVGPAASIPGGQSTAYHEFATGSRLGWAGGLARYSEGPSDQAIIEHLVTAGEHVMWANRTSFGPAFAWPSWQQIKGQFVSWASNLARNRNDQTRRSLAGMVTSSAASLAQQVAVQTVGETIQRANCDQAYVQLGFELAYGQQTLGIAAEAAGGRDTELVRRAQQDAFTHLQAAVQILMAYRGIHLASGVCADFSGIQEMVQSAMQVRDLATEYSTAEAAWKTALERVQNIGRAQPGSYDECLKKYCPVCQQVVSLIGVDAGPECQACKTRNQKLIADCVSGSSAPVSRAAQMPAPRLPATSPPSAPPDPGELQGTWFECDASGIVQWRFNNQQAATVLAQCLQSRRSSNLPGPPPDFKVRFSKSGNGYSGTVVGERLTSPRDVGITSTGMADPRYRQGMEMFRVTKTGSNSYQGQVQWFSVNGGEDKFRWGDDSIVVEGDVATETSMGTGRRVVKWVRCAATAP